MPSRRGFLRSTLGACWTGAVLLEQAVFRAAHARALAPDNGPRLFDIEKAAPGVYAAIARPQVILNCNAAIFERSKDLLLVDTHSKPSAVLSLVSQIRREVSAKPVRYIVNSHFHWDHTQGSPTYRRLAPNADVIASETTRRLLNEFGAARLKQSLDQIPKQLDGYREKAAAAKSPADREHYASLVTQSEAYLREMKDYAPELPTVTFDRDLILHDSQQELHLAFRGRAHTAGDVVVWSPSGKVLATGDTLHGFAPYIADAYPKEWPITLLRYAEMQFDAVIGGHGGVQRTRDRLYQVAAYLDELADGVGRARQRGRTLDEVQNQFTPAALKSLQGSYGDYLLDARKYLVTDPAETAEAWLAAAVKSNVADVYRTIEKS